MGRRLPIAHESVQTNSFRGKEKSRAERCGRFGCTACRGGNFGGIKPGRRL